MTDTGTPEAGPLDSCRAADGASWASGAKDHAWLNKLINDPALKDALVLINEFGEIGLDHQSRAVGRPPRWS